MWIQAQKRYWHLTRAEKDILNRDLPKTSENITTECVLHCNYFSLSSQHFEQCTLPDQVAVFRYVDRYISPNHVLYMILKEQLMTKARVHAINRQTGKQGRWDRNVRRERDPPNVSVLRKHTDVNRLQKNVDRECAKLW
jgi:hypothetical protein